ncbi:hypothetical protein NXH76_12040 [Blautia schinkii]|nr:hypothetical protein [Blautia schinkii]
MTYKANIKVVHGGKLYPAGTILPDTISKADIEFLKSRGYLTPCEDEAAAADDFDDDFDEATPEDDFKTADEIGKLRSKKDVKDYADKIGCDLGDAWEDKTLKELKEAVILYQDEQEAAADAE